MKRILEDKVFFWFFRGLENKREGNESDSFRLVDSLRHTLRGEVPDVHIASWFVYVDIIAVSAVCVAAARTGLTNLVTLEGVLAGKLNTREPELHQVILLSRLGWIWEFLGDRHILAAHTHQRVQIRHILHTVDRIAAYNTGHFFSNLA